MTGQSGRNLMQNIFHRVIGARGGLTNMGIPHQEPEQQQQSQQIKENDHHHQKQSQPQLTGTFSPIMTTTTSIMEKNSNFGHLYDNHTIAQEIAQQHRIVFFGEIHSQSSIIAFQRKLQEQMVYETSSSSSGDGDGVGGGGGTLHVVLEHFSFDMQDILDKYQMGDISFDELVQQYQTIGTESHNLEPYREFLEDTKQYPNNKIQLHAGFVPRTFARLLMKEGHDIALQAAAQWLPPRSSNNVASLIQGGEEHYNLFESLLTGRSIYSQQSPDDRFRKIFQAQLLKDVAMSHKINQILTIVSNIKEDKILVLAGNGHVLGYCGVPERVLQQYPDLASETCVIVSHQLPPATTISPLLPQDPIRLTDYIINDVEQAFGPSGTNPADYVYVYQDPSTNEEKSSSVSSSFSATENSQAVKAETKKAYDKVGESAHYQGNMAKALAIMKNMGYSQRQIDVAGEDAYNFQGVGNPHIHANIQPGETVLDIGSGLGIDSYIAHQMTVGLPNRHEPEKEEEEARRGIVIGIDISDTEVKYAQACAQRRNLDRIRFVVADMESIPLPDNSVDVVISNGAFCLAPSKEQAFAEVFRVLKPGGRISICTTTTLEEDKLAPDVSWPICMRMFISQNEIQPMCERIGFVDVLVDDTDSSMSMELPEEVVVNENDNPNSEKRNKVHVGSSEFRHLENYDMDAICARVCIAARKAEGEK